jgi:uncharacterized repeat protein (TIGR03803 family)
MNSSLRPPTTPMPSKGSLGLLAAFILALGFFATAAPAFAASNEKVIYSFCANQPCPDGSSPVGALISDAAGNLYGTAYWGGTPGCGYYGCGVVFELTPRKDGGWMESVLHAFSGKNGENPEGTLVFDATGNLYGTTTAGGDLSACGGLGCGVVLKLAKKANGEWNTEVLHIFHGNDGATPSAGVILDSTGNLYGTTSNGGDQSCGYPQMGCGVVFSLSPGANGKWIETVLHRFTIDEGNAPVGSLIFDAAGNLYGTTISGGTAFNGTVFKLAPTEGGRWTETLIRNFGSQDGANPEAGLIFDATGNLYGTTYSGGYGMYGGGTVFRLTPHANDKWTETILHTFNYHYQFKKGYGPMGGVVLDTGGNVYGTTAYGGDGFGTVFKLMPDANGKWSDTVLHTFNGKDGALPFAGLVFGTSGKLYGATQGGGTYTYVRSSRLRRRRVSRFPARYTRLKQRTEVHN